MFACCCCASPDKEGEMVTGVTSVKHNEALVEETPEAEREEVVSFECELERDGGGELGLMLDAWGSLGLQVLRFKAGGVVAEYNGSAKVGRVILQNDFIVAVNGIKSVKGMKDALQKQKLSLQVVRPVRHNMAVNREAAEKWGLALQMSPMKEGGACLLVQGINAGAVQRHNAAAEEADPKEGQLLANDLILSANGLAGDTRGMQKAMINADRLQLEVLRLPAC